MAYNIGKFVGFSKLPPWDDIAARLGTGEPEAPMTDEEIMHAMDLHIVGMRARGMTPETA